MSVLVVDEQGSRGGGRVKNISGSGVWIEGADLIPSVGSRLRICLVLAGCDRGLRVRAEVVRHTAQRGFAARFVSMSRQKQVTLRLLLRSLARTFDDDCEEDETATSWSGDLKGRLGPDLYALLGQLARENELTAAELLRESARRGLLDLLNDGSHGLEE